jgi:hypothetical protein
VPAPRWHRWARVVFFVVALLALVLIAAYWVG